MKIISFSQQIIKVAILVFMANLITTGCSAHPNNSINCKDSAINKDSIMHKAIGDSIYTIISKAKKIKAEIIQLETDSVPLQSRISVRYKYIPLINFVVSDPQIYNVSTPAYGSFMPRFSLTFIKKKRETCIAKFDFALKKWAICDDKGNKLKTFDLSSDNMLRVADLLFPNNEYFQSLINTEKR